VATVVEDANSAAVPGPKNCSICSASLWAVCCPYVAIAVRAIQRTEILGLMVGYCSSVGVLYVGNVVAQ
jgi:hypothetical protein